MPMMVIVMVVVISHWSSPVVHILIKFWGGGELDCGTDFLNSDIQILDRIDHKIMQIDLHYLHIQT